MFVPSFLHITLKMKNYKNGLICNKNAFALNFLLKSMPREGEQILSFFGKSNVRWNDITGSTGVYYLNLYMFEPWKSTF